jgi:hypothetical protein
MPQPLHCALAQVPRLVPQLEPLATQTRLAPQQLLPVQVAPGQQGSPVPPHA